MRLIAYEPARGSKAKNTFRRWFSVLWCLVASGGPSDSERARKNWSEALFVNALALLFGLLLHQCGWLL